ncbi:MAG TPA: PD-(D/E)XK nuclease family transposase [Chlamydiales bacterium]|nr:PD-(D/E)XK nuclease family transposase [Chlamydiales bacterium]
MIRFNAFLLSPFLYTGAHSVIRNQVNSPIQPLVRDGVFKRLFWDVHNPKKIIHFLHSVRPLSDSARKIEKIEFQNPYFPAYSRGEKDIYVDVICRSTDVEGKNPEIHIIEMQQVENEGYMKRWDFYASRCYSMELNRCKKYDQLIKIHVVAVMNHPCKYPNDLYQLTGKSSGVRVPETRELTILSLSDLNSTLVHEDTDSKKWSHLIKFSGRPELQEEVLSKDPVFFQAISDLRSMGKVDPLPARESKGKPWKLLYRDIKSAG